MKKSYFYVCLALLIFTFLPGLYCQEYGLVLAGGGGKGAYEVGVWKALEEYGIARKVTVISGSSVGGLNGALFACTGVENAQSLWLNMVPDELQNEDELISQDGIKRILSQVDLYRLQGKNFYPKVYITAVRARYAILKIAVSWLYEPGVNAHRFLLNEEKTIEEMQRKLLATSAFPLAAKKIRLSDGYDYVDGGDELRGGDNTPVNPIINAYEIPVDYLVVIHLDHKAKRISNRSEVLESGFKPSNICEIIPSKDLGGLFEGTLNFSREKIQSLINLGYSDAVKILERSGFVPVKCRDFWYEE